MNRADETRIVAKLEWEAANEKLGNFLQPLLPGLPVAEPAQLKDCFDYLQSRLDAMRAAFGVPPRMS